MNIAFDTDLPFSFAHGGFQVQIEQTKIALEKIGVRVSWLQRWDDSESPDIIHHFGELNLRYLSFAQERGIKVILTELRGGLGGRPPAVIALQKAIFRTAQKMLPRSVLGRLKLDTYRRVDAAIAGTSWEAYLMEKVLGCPKDRLHLVPNGVEDLFFETTPVPRTEWVVCPATIHPRKRILDLALAAVEARVPLWIIGKPYSETEEYYQRFLSVARAHPHFVRYEGAIEDRRALAAIYRGARGFALISSVETRSLSAEEAAASQCPLMLTDLPWARATFGTGAFYSAKTTNVQMIASDLGRFYESAPSAIPSFVPLRWTDIAEQLKQVYQTLLLNPERVPLGSTGSSESPAKSLANETDR